MIAVNVGAGELIVNGLLLLTPAGVVTVTLAAPGRALLAMVKVAVICEEPTVTLLTETPFGAFTVVGVPKAPIAGAAGTKQVPVNVTDTFAPGAPLLGAIEFNVGSTAKETLLLVPAWVETVTGPVPPLRQTAILNTAVICVEDATTTLLTLMPSGAVTVVPPGTKPVPVKVTWTVAPSVPLLGLMELSVGLGTG